MWKQDTIVSLSKHRVLSSFPLPLTKDRTCYWCNFFICFSIFSSVLSREKDANLGTVLICWAGTGRCLRQGQVKVRGAPGWALNSIIFESFTHKVVTQITIWHSCPFSKWSWHLCPYWSEGVARTISLQNSCVEALTPSTSEYGCIWKQVLLRGN